MALRFLERRLRRLLAERGREELADVAVGSVGFTDDGGTIYVHLQPKEGWNFDTVQFAMRESSKRPAMAFVTFTREADPDA